MVRDRIENTQQSWLRFGRLFVLRTWAGWGVLRRLGTQWMKDIFSRRSSTTRLLSRLDRRSSCVCVTRAFPRAVTSSRAPSRLSGCSFRATRHRGQSGSSRPRAAPRVGRNGTRHLARQSAHGPSHRTPLPELGIFHNVARVNDHPGSRSLSSGGRSPFVITVSLTLEPRRAYVVLKTHGVFGVVFVSAPFAASD